MLKRHRFKVADSTTRKEETCWSRIRVRALYILNWYEKGRNNTWRTTPTHKAAFLMNVCSMHPCRTSFCRFRSPRPYEFYSVNIQCGQSLYLNNLGVVVKHHYELLIFHDFLILVPAGVQLYPRHFNVHVTPILSDLRDKWWL